MNNKKFLAKVMVITMMAISLSLSAHARSLPTDDPGMGTPDGKVTDNVPATILSPIAVPGLPDPSTANFGSRSWTCHTTIALVNSGHSYVPEPWGMSGGILTDRAKRCKEYIQANWIDNGAIWKKLGIPTTEMDSLCKSGGSFRVDYGFDKRGKEWTFTASGKPLCTAPCGLVFL